MNVLCPSVMLGQVSKLRAHSAQRGLPLSTWDECRLGRHIYILPEPEVAPESTDGDTGTSENSEGTAVHLLSAQLTDVHVQLFKE